MTGLMGKCVCGAVEVTAQGDVNHAHACHCGVCRGQNAGGAFHGVTFSGGVDFKGAHLKWFASSAYGERGFCDVCGSTIAWRIQGNPASAITSLGVFENIGAKIEAHVFADHAGDYYTLGTDVPHKTGEQIFAEFGVPNVDDTDA